MVFIKKASLLALLYYQSSSVNAAVWDSSDSNDISVKEAALELTKIYENADPEEKSVLLQDEDFMNSIAFVTNYYEAPLKNFELDSFEDEDEDGEMEYFFEDEDEDEDESSDSDSWSDSYSSSDSISSSHSDSWSDSYSSSDSMSSSDSDSWSDSYSSSDSESWSDSDSWSDSYSSSDSDSWSDSYESVDTGLEISPKNAIKLIDTIPDRSVNEQVHDKIKSGDVKGAEDLVHEYFDKNMADEKDDEAKQILLANKEKIIKALDFAVEHYNEKAYDEDSFEKDVTKVNIEEMIDSIIDKSVNEKVSAKIMSGDVKGAEGLVHEYFDKNMADEKDDEAKQIILANKEKIIKALDFAVEHYNEKAYDEGSFEKDVTKKTIENALDAIKRDQAKIEKLVKGLRGI